MDSKRRWFVINRGEQWREGYLDDLAVEGDTVALLAGKGVFHGRVYLASIDGGERDFDWRRLVIDAELPEDTLLQVDYYISNHKELSDEEPDIDAYLHDPSVSPKLKASCLDKMYGNTVRGATDMLLCGRGRYLWLRLELYATGTRRPRINALRMELSGDHMMDYMPAAYRRMDKNGFLQRYLSIFNSLTTDMESAVYRIAQAFDYERCDEDMLRFLAGWICVDDAGLSAGALREEMADALAHYETMHTPEAIKRQICRWTGFMPEIIEHFQIRECLSRSKDRELYKRLYGDNPYKFFMLLDEKAFASKREADQFLARLKGRIPAHIEADLVLLKPTIHLDWHTYLGINSIIGGYAPVAIDEMVALQHDTIIGGAEQ